MRALAWMFFVACSSPQHTASAPPSPATPAPAAKSCPATYAAAAGHCSSMDSCTYPEGSCSCGPPEWCGGAAPPPFTAKDYAWRCTPKVRADGCPGQEPPAGSPCRQDGLKCDYTCSCSFVATCTSGKWVEQEGPCKP